MPHPHKRRGKGGKTISAKIHFLISHEGLTRDQAAGKAYGMARHGNLGTAAKKAAGAKKPRRHRVRTRVRRA